MASGGIVEGLAGVHGHPCTREEYPPCHGIESSKAFQFYYLRPVYLAGPLLSAGECLSLGKQKPTDIGGEVYTVPAMSQAEEMD